MEGPCGPWWELRHWSTNNGRLLGRSKWMAWSTTCGLVPCCLGSLNLGEAGCHVVRALKQLHGEVHVASNWGLPPTARMTLPVMWVNPNPTVPVTLTDDLQAPIPWTQPHQRTSHNTQINDSWNSWPSETIWILNGYCCLKLLTSGVICYITVD